MNEPMSSVNEFCKSFQFLLRNSFNSLLAENRLQSHRFLIKQISSKLNTFNLSSTATSFHDNEDVHILSSVDITSVLSLFNCKPYFRPSRWVLPHILAGIC